MTFVTRSARILKLVRRVFQKIPEEDRVRIQRFLSAVRCSKEWNLLGLGMEINQTAGGLYPIFSLTSGQFQPIGAFVEFNLPICRLFSDRAMVGIVAHEFAHARRASRIQGDWDAKMRQRYRAEERHADAIATTWGFGPNIEAMRRERREIVTPYVEKHEVLIVGQVLRRNQRWDKIARQKWEAASQHTAP